MFLSILSIACICLHFGSGYGQLGNLGTAVQGAQLMNNLGASNVVPKCNCPVDHSCDDMSFADISSKIAGGGLMSGAQKGILGGAMPSLPGGRRKRGLFGNKLALPAAPAPAPAAPMASNMLNPAGGANQLSSLGKVPGTSFFSDPKGMGPTAVQNKLNKCDQNNKPGGQFDQLKTQLSSGDFKSLTNPQAISAGDTCKQFMDTNKQQCQMLKRQCCAFLNGGVKDPAQLSCTFKDIMATSGKIQAENSACNTAQDLMKNPGNAGNTLQNGAKGIGTGVALNQGANSVLG
jgi:hypothetical protein